MPSTYTLISSNVLTSSAASVTFSAIPSTYTDLEIRFSARGDNASVNSYAVFTLNGTTANYSETRIEWDGSSVGSYRRSSASNIQLLSVGGSTVTANTFSSHSIYIPNYTASQNKPISVSFNRENNATGGYLGALAGLWSNTAAVNSITITNASGNFVAGSSFYLYGISKS